MLNSSYFVTLYFLLLLIACTAFATPDAEKNSFAAGNNAQQLSTLPQQNGLENNAIVSNTSPNAIAANNNNNDPTTDHAGLNSGKRNDVDGAAPAIKNNPSPALADKNLPKPNEQQQNTGKEDDSPSAEQRSQQGPLVKIKDADDFCFFLPPQPNQEVAPTEDYGVAHCTSDNVVKGNKVFPDGFITKMHYNYNKTSSYVQVTGYLDSEKYGLLANDDGGQVCK